MILIVDDTSENIFALRKLLELHKYETDTAFSGEEALRKILKQDYSLIILDVQMPDMDGFEVAENITGFSKSKDIPIIFLSAVNIDKQFITKGYSSGAVDYVTKPFDPDILLLKVKTFIRLHEQQMALNTMQAELAFANVELENRISTRTAELMRKNRELESTNQELKQFANVTSHDLKEPLRKIQVFGSIMRQKFSKENAELADFVERINTSASRMTQIIEDLLMFSKLSMQEKCEPVDLNEIVSELMQDYEIIIAEKNAVFKIGTLPKIEGVKQEIRQLFQNIISNALKFSKENVPPVISIHADSLPDCEELPEETISCVRISISDNGIGFEKQYAHKIFTIFQRLHAKEAYEGTGIGLAIAKKIVDKHHGSIKVNSTISEGTTFTVTLPTEQPMLSEFSEHF